VRRMFLVATILGAFAFSSKIKATPGGIAGEYANTQYTKQEFAEFLTVSLVSNQLLIARRLTDGSVKEQSFRDYISTLFTIWLSNRAMPEPLLRTEFVDSLLRALAEQPEILKNQSFLDDPLFLSTIPKDEWLQKLPWLAGFPEHLSKVYARQLLGDYEKESKAFREKVVSLMKANE